MTAQRPTKADKRSAVLRPSERPRIDRGGGASTVQLVTPEVGSTSVLNGITSFAPGASIPLHKHNCEESVLVLEGKALIEVDGETRELAMLDTTWIAAGVPHRFINASATDPMRIFWTYASIHADRTIIATGETRPIIAEHGSARRT
ncbi:MAG TPA: cupin domain-containing protein [Hyphomicrobiaceae bacterium]|nr:cupin domain-containing protein [Hyphomicrobiaceae bacterium]